MSPRIARWKSAWEKGNLVELLALYRSDARHASAMPAPWWRRGGAVVARVLPDLGRGEVVGIDEIREYFSTALRMAPTRRFEIVGLTENAERSVIEYLSHTQRRDQPKHVVEILEWQDERLRAVRVFHF